jgi:hypothetical protein
VVKGQRTAWGVLVGFVVLVLATTIISVVTSARVPDYGSLPADNPGAAATLGQAVTNTLSSKSFTMQVVQSVTTEGGLAVGRIRYSVRYQAPDTTILRIGSLTFDQSAGRRSVAGGSGERRAVGTCPLAGELRTSPAIGETDLLLGALSVQEDAGVYTAELLDAKAPGGQLAREIVIRSTIRDGRLLTEAISSTSKDATGDFAITYTGYDSGNSTVSHLTPMYNAYVSTLCLNATWSGWVGFSPSQG